MEHCPAHEDMIDVELVEDPQIEEVKVEPQEDLLAATQQFDNAAAANDPVMLQFD